MSKFQLFPSIAFDESNVGPRPFRQVAVDRVGMAALFKRAPSGPAIVDQSAAKSLFGEDNSVGSVHVQGVFDQGVGDVLISPVRPAARTASLAVTVSGPATEPGTITVHLDNGTAVTTHAVAVADNATATTIATNIEAAVVAAISAEDLPFTVARVGAALTFTAEAGGTAGNSYKVRFATSDVVGVTYNVAGIVTTLTAFSGGVAAPIASSVTLADEDSLDTLELTIIGEGALANAVTATVTNALDDDRFDLVLEWAAMGLKEIYKDVDLTDVYDEDKLSALKNSELATGVVLSDAKVPVPITASFSGGTDGDSTLTTADFTRAIDAMADIQCTVIICPGLKPSGVDQWSLNAVLVAQAEAGEANMGEIVGLRIAVIPAPRGMAVADLAGLRSAGRIIPSNRCVMVAGWATSARVKQFKRFGVDPSALYAGHLVMTPVHVSPSAQTSSPTIKGIVEVDTPVGVSAWNEITRYKVEALVIQPGSGGFHCLNGLSTSADPAWSVITVRRQYDDLRTDLFLQMQYLKSEPLTPTQDRDVMQAIDAYLDNKLQSGKIAGYSPTVSDASNNKPATRQQRQRFADIFIEPLYPNDFMQLNINRVLQGTIRLV